MSPPRRAFLLSDLQVFGQRQDEPDIHAGLVITVSMLALLQVQEVDLSAGAGSIVANSREPAASQNCLRIIRLTYSPRL